VSHVRGFRGHVRYALAAAKALPNATQVADRWHLTESARSAFLDAVRKSMRQIRSVIGTATINPNLVTVAERIQYEGNLRREADTAAIFRLAKDGSRLRRSCAGPDTAAASSGVSCVDSVPTSSACESARSSSICLGSTSAGPLAIATRLHFGDG
jgi:hypothetical protein